MSVMAIYRQLSNRPYNTEQCLFSPDPARSKRSAAESGLTIGISPKRRLTSQFERTGRMILPVLLPMVTTTVVVPLVGSPLAPAPWDWKLYEALVEAMRI